MLATLPRRRLASPAQDTSLENALALVRTDVRARKAGSQPRDGASDSRPHLLPGREYEAKTAKLG
jgi:hypothetical protein